MQVLSVRCGLTKNLGNYESAKLEIEASPSDGQTADQLLEEVGAYLNKQVEAAISAAGGAKPASGKENGNKTTTAPLAGNGKGSQKAQRQAALSGNGTTAPAGSPASQLTAEPAAPDDAPFDVDSAPAAEPGPAKPKRGRPKKPSAADMAKERASRLKFALEAETLGELLARFNIARDRELGFPPVEEWAESCRQLHGLFKNLRVKAGVAADDDTVSELCKSFKAEQTYIATERDKTANAAA